MGSGEQLEARIKMPEQPNQPWPWDMSHDVAHQRPQDLVHNPQDKVTEGENYGGNSGISEFLSLVLEPLAREQSGNKEINATNGLLADISDLNKDLDSEKESEVVSIPEEQFSKWS